MEKESQLEKLKTRMTLADFPLSPKAKKLIQDKIEKEKKEKERLEIEEKERQIEYAKRRAEIIRNEELEKQRKIELEKAENEIKKKETEKTKQVSENTHIEEIKELETDKIKEELGTSEETKLDLTPERGLFDEDEKPGWSLSDDEIEDEIHYSPPLILKDETQANKQELENLKTEVKKVTLYKIQYDKNFKYKAEGRKQKDWLKMNEEWEIYTHIYETLKKKSIDEKDVKMFKAKYEFVDCSEYKIIFETDELKDIPDGLMWKARWGDVIDYRYSPQKKISHSLWTLKEKFLWKYPDLFEST